MLLIACDLEKNNSDLIQYDDYTTETQWSTQNNCELYFINMSSYLNKDNNGFYHMSFLIGYDQTFTTLVTETGSLNQYQKIKFISNKEILINGFWVNIINSSGYTDANGLAHGVVGVWETFIDDTIKVYSGYTDECSTHHIDSLEIIIH